MRKINSVTVVGAGLMGHALALVHSIGGCHVKLQDISTKQLSLGMELIGGALDTMIAAGAVKEQKRIEILGRIEAVEDLKLAVADADLIVEAVVENIDVKVEVFKGIDAVASLDVVIASNTSNLDIFPLVPKRRLKNCIIAHWYTPPYIIDLVDLAASSETDLTILNKMEQFYLRMGKKPVKFERFISGYVANRLQAAMGLEINKLLDEGWATPKAIDDSVKYGLSLRMALMGSLMKADFTGLDMMQRGMANRTYDPPVPKGNSPSLDKLLEVGRGGVMSGAGYFDYNGMSPAELFKNRDVGLLRLKSEVAQIEEIYPLGRPYTK
jgi:3-hydroxybutyryl-CoA dehydrogenase